MQATLSRIDAEPIERLIEQLEQLEQFARFPTQLTSWIRSAVHLHPTDQLHIALVRDGQDIVAGIVLAKARRRLVRRWVIAGSLHHYEPAGPIYRNQAGLAALIKVLDRSGYPLEFSRISADEAWIPNIQLYLRHQTKFSMHAAGSCPVINLHTGWEDPASQLSSRRRSDLRRAYRRAQETGEIAVSVLTPSRVDTESVMRRAMAIEAASWKGKVGTAMSTSPVYASFFKELAQNVAAHQALRVSFLQIGGTDAAMQIAIAFDASWWVFKIGYDEAFSRCSPGTILIGETIKYATENNCNRFEFLGTSEPWLSMWTDQHRQMVSVSTYPGNWRGVVAVIVDLLVRGTRWARRTILQWSQRSGSN